MLIDALLERPKDKRLKPEGSRPWARWRSHESAAPLAAWPQKRSPGLFRGRVLAQHLDHTDYEPGDLWRRRVVLCPKNTAAENPKAKPSISAIDAETASDSTSIRDAKRIRVQTAVAKSAVPTVNLFFVVSISNTIL